METLFWTIAVRAESRGFADVTLSLGFFSVFCAADRSLIALQLLVCLQLLCELILFHMFACHMVHGIRTID